MVGNMKQHCKLFFLSFFLATTISASGPAPMVIDENHAEDDGELEKEVAVLTLHKKKKIKRLKCSYCGKTFLKTDFLNLHLRKHISSQNGVQKRIKRKNTRPDSPRLNVRSSLPSLNLLKALLKGSINFSKKKPINL